jgi:hypothetical protein
MLLLRWWFDFLQWDRPAGAGEVIPWRDDWNCRSPTPFSGVNDQCLDDRIELQSNQLLG